jgi:hypothetical protein
MRRKEAVTTIETNLLRLQYDQPTRRWSLYERSSGEWRCLIQSAYGQLSTRDGQVFRTDDRQASVKVKRKRTSDFAGRGTTLRIVSLQNSLEITTLLTLYKEGRSLSVGLTVKNRSKETLPCNDLTVFQTSDDGGVIFGDKKLIAGINGYQSWSESEIFELDREEHTSYWQVVLFSPEEKRSLLFGFLTNQLSINSFDIRRTSANTPLSVGSHSALSPLALVPHGTIRSDLVLIQLDDSALSNLKRYADLSFKFSTGKKTDFKKSGTAFGQPPAGWYSWYYFYSRVTESDVLANLRAARDHFHDVRLQYIQIDDGYQRAAGDWETNDKFPQGHRWLTKQIHKSGFLAGLWVAPFAVAASSDLFKSHPDWVLKDQSGSPMKILTLEHWGGETYALDPTVSEVRRWLTKFFHKVTHKWGYDYVKIDFLYFVAEGTNFKERVTSVQAYRMGLQAIRKGVGPKKFILGCGAPLGPSVGLVDGMRIGPDVEASWNGLVPPVAATAFRFYDHNRSWYNDPDCLVAREPLTIDQARMWASVVALSGQMNILSDHLPALPADRLELLRKTLPVLGDSADPLDLFEPREDIGMTIQNDVGEKFHLSRLLKFTTGDDLKWKEQTLDDAGWSDVEVPNEWEKYNGLVNYDGMGWYRLRFYLPSGWRETDLTLHLGRIDDCDETYLNGKLIGATGSMPPNYGSASNLFRTYRISKTVLNWKGENVLAVRAYDGGGRGGLYSLRKLHLPRIWNLRVKKKFGEWNVVGVFNWAECSEKVEIGFSDLGLSSDGHYLAYELWSDSLLGEFTNKIELDLAPTSSKVLAIHKVQERPVVMSTSRHLTMGALDLESVEWNARKLYLNGRSVNMVPGDYTLMVWLPSGYQFAKAEPAKVYQGATRSGTLLKVTFKLKYLKPFDWKLEFVRKEG